MGRFFDYIYKNVIYYKVIDGDTIYVEYGDGLGDTIRFSDIDAPDINNFRIVPGRLFNLYLEAKKYVENKLKSAIYLRIRSDKLGEFRKDRYGRILAIVEYMDNYSVEWQNLNEELLNVGLAKKYIEQ